MKRSWLMVMAASFLAFAACERAPEEEPAVEEVEEAPEVTPAPAPMAPTDTMPMDTMPMDTMPRQP